MPSFRFVRITSSGLWECNAPDRTNISERIPCHQLWCPIRNSHPRNKWDTLGLGPVCVGPTPSTRSADDSEILNSESEFRTPYVSKLKQTFLEFIVWSTGPTRVGKRVHYLSKFRKNVSKCPKHGRNGSARFLSPSHVKMTPMKVLLPS